MSGPGAALTAPALTNDLEGVADMAKRSPADRFHEKYVVNTETGCWEWTRHLDAGGYSHMSVDGRQVKAHRFAYELLVGPIPEGMEIDHLCRVRHCVNPEHLEPVTRQENVRRSNHVSQMWASRTHCPQGHPYDEANTHYKTYKAGHIGRVCRACGRDYMRRRRAARRRAA